MKNTFCLLFLTIILSGCATIPMNEMISDTSKTGATQIFNYPYEDVFKVCGQALLNTTQTIEISEENIEKGYIFARTFSWHLKDNSIGPQFMILVERVSENETKVTIRKYRDMGVGQYYRRYFSEAARLLKYTDSKR